MKRCLVRYEGRVQGVGFRFTAVRQAKGLNLNGFIRNEPDGSVLMDVEGEGEHVRQLMDRIDSEMQEQIDTSTVELRPLRGHQGGFTIQD